MITQSLEGTWEEVRQEMWDKIQHLPFDKTQHVQFVFTCDAANTSESKEPKVVKMLTLGMFPELAGLTDEDFKSAEYQGDEDNVL